VPKATIRERQASPVSFTFEPTPIGLARLGSLQTPHGVVNTPQFMPVGTQATVKSLTPGDLRTAGTEILLGNAYHLALRPGHVRIASLGGLHRFMAWDGPILTDSGGFQVFSLAHLRSADDDGVTFASHLDGSPQRFTPERVMEIQEALGSDIAMAFDQPAEPMAAPLLVERNLRWAERSLAAHSRPDQALFGIIQGGLDPAARRRAAEDIAALPFDGLAVGGLSLGESKTDMAAMLDVVADALGDDRRVRYLMGVGSPLDFFTGVERGIDLFDCVLPTRVARNGQLWSSAGKLNLRNARFMDDPTPIDSECGCEACRNHSRAYVAHLFRADELLAYRLASLHNVTYTLDLMRRIRGALLDGSFASLRDRIAAQFGTTGAGPISRR
jgi:queuine tRNA-ribosyltransferase